MSRLQGKTAVITGGAGEIGLAAAKLFAREGAKVLLVDLNKDALEKAVTAVGAEAASAFAADVTQEEQVKAYVRAAVERYGGIDVFLNNAGIEGVVKNIVEFPTEVFDRVIAVNVRGVWLGLKHVIPVMQQRGGGSIVITSSNAGYHGMPAMSAYVTSKHAVVGMMRTAAVECAPLNIRVNTVHPSPIESRMMRSLESGFAQAVSVEPAQVRPLIAGQLPRGQYGTPEEVAHLMLFLASDESSHCTGGLYPVDGGSSAR